MHAVAINVCAMRDGGIYCRHCGRKVGDPTTEKERARGQPQYLEKMQVDHIDGDPNNNPPDGTNWQLLCMTCNLKKGNQPEHPVTSPREKRMAEIVRKEKTSLQDAAHEVKQKVDYSAGDVSVQINGICQARFVDWLMSKIKHYGVYPKKDAINGGAYIAGCNILTTKRYLEPLTSPEGPLQEIKSDGETLLTMRMEGE